MEHQDTKLTSMRPRLKELNDNPYFKNLGGFYKILGVSSGILEDSWRILREFSVGYSNSHMALPEAFFVEQTLQYCWTLSPLCFQSL